MIELFAHAAQIAFGRAGIGAHVSADAAAAAQTVTADPRGQQHQKCLTVAVYNLASAISKILRLTL